jgi:uncharacterized Rossmann fold enzyme
MLHVACVKAGTRYGPEYVNTLFDMVRRNLPAGLAGRFVCLTDDPTGLEEGIAVQPLPGGLIGWWNKLYLFAPETFPKGDRVLYFDLDTAITGPLDAIVAYQGPFAILRDAYRKGGLQSAVMAWEAGTLTHLWQDWYFGNKPECVGGDQEWIEEQTQGFVRERWQDLFPGKFRSYKVECRTQIPRGTAVVFFHGHPRPHEVLSGWVPEVWKIGGGSGIEWIVQANVDETTLRFNVAHARERLCRWVTPGDDTRTAIIVGGGPSLVDHLFYIRGMQLAGGVVYAVGNVFAYLKAHGIVPDAHVLLDARPENIDFVPTDDVPKYYASQCHPSLLTRAGGGLLCWHAAMASYQGLIEKSDQVSIGGGSTVGLKAIALAYTLGHRHLRLFGFDSSYGPSHHAYDQPLNDGEKTLDVKLGGRTFKCAPWMVTQAEEFKELMPLLLQDGCVVRIFGDGLIPHIASLLKPSAVEERAQQLLTWLEDTLEPVGAEVGVFAGELSGRLLARTDVTLFLIDHWTTSEAESSYAQSGDFHAVLSQEQQEEYFRATLENVKFAGSRAQILRGASIDMAKVIPDASLDFVFLDADHSYTGCRADIQAWLPKIKPTGFIAGHDYDHPEFPAWGVKQAVAELGTPELGANYTWRIRLGDLDVHRHAELCAPAGA